MGRKPKPPKPPKPIPAPPLSVDGDHIVAGDGKSLYTAEGTWTFGNGGQPGGWAILLNGASAAGGSAVELWIENGGQVYALNSAAAWFIWQGGDWWTTTDPHPQPIPPEPEPIPPDPEPEPPDPPVPVPPGDTEVRLILSTGETLVYLESEAVNLGEWENPYSGAKQRLLRVTKATLPHVHVLIRPEADGSRLEVGVETGLLWPQTLIEPIDLPPYTLQILKGGAKIGELSAPKHYFRQRHRWQSAQRAVLRTYDKLLNDGHVPNFSGSRGYPVPAPIAYETLKHNGVTSYMPMTGAHHDIGPHTDHAGYYLATGDGADNLLAQAEAAGSFKWCHRDERTGAPFDFITNPNATFDYRQWLWNVTPQLMQDAGNGWQEPAAGTWDQAHCPNLSFVAFAMTGDLWHLENLQFAANGLFGLDPDSQPGEPRHLEYIDQTRGRGWTLNLIFHAARAMQIAKGAPGLQPLTYWEAILENCRRYFENDHLQNAANKCAIFRSVGVPDGLPFWQEARFLMVVGIGISFGYSQWLPAFHWGVEGVIQRHNGTSGWPSSMPLPVSGWAVPHSWAVNNWADFAAQNGVTPTADGLLHPSLDGEYVQFDREALYWGTKHATPGAAECFARLDEQMRGKYLLRWNSALA